MTNPTLQVRLARLAPGADVLFVYGTLRFPRILTALLGRVPTGTPAVVSGWRAAALNDRPYPGLVEAPGGRASGLLLAGLTVREWRILDDFEDDEYDLRKLPLDGPQHDGTPGTGWAYTWESPDAIRPEDWDADAFASGLLDAYAARLEAAD
ncbi:hypothetical protein GCM10009801_52070 [Streptomyces albiaxialis]|uniref:Putative gamma-glutamylcyclotransferase n=1 Tax=Streptomyces albiaxialis TaxID=329523 RepID=A0ABN2WBY6_9ACTN